MALAQDQFLVVGPALLFLLVAWIFIVWRGYRFGRHMLFRSLPFLIIIVLFADAFYAERIH